VAGTFDPLSDLNIDSAEQEQLRRALGASDDDDLKARVKQLRIIAAKEIVDWLLGRHRYITTAECDAARVLQIFRDIRKESPTLAALANDFELSPGRSASIAARLRYGEGRTFEALRYQAARQAITAKLPGRPKDLDERQALYLTPDISEVIMQVAASIMLDTAQRAKGGKWENAEMPVEQRRRGIAVVTASVRMWGFIQAELDSHAKSFGTA
jgi:hypothetical protein